MKIYEMLFIVGAIFVIIGLIPAFVDSIKTLKDFLYDFKSDKAFVFEVLMFAVAIVIFFIGIAIMLITKVHNG